MPSELKELQQVMEQRNQGRGLNRGRREFIQVLRLLETTKLSELCFVVAQAFERRAVSFDAIRHLLMSRQQQSIAHLDLRTYPYLRRMDIAITNPANYMELLGSVTNRANKPISAFEAGVSS